MREQDTCRRSRGVQHALRQGGDRNPIFAKRLLAQEECSLWISWALMHRRLVLSTWSVQSFRYAVVGAFLPPTRLQLSEQSHLESHAKQEGLSSPLWQPSQEESNLPPLEYEEPAAGETREDPSATGPNSFYFVEFVTSKGQQEVCLAHSAHVLSH